MGPTVFCDSGFTQVLLKTGVMMSATKVECFDNWVVLHGPRMMVSVVRPTTEQEHKAAEEKGEKVENSQISNMIEQVSRRAIPVGAVHEVSIIDYKLMNPETLKNYELLTGIKIAK